jgi:hypothetical protein
MKWWTWVKTYVSRKKEPEMARAKREPVRFNVLDGVKPNRVGPARVFNLKAPIALNIPPGASVRVNLGVSCNYPLHVFQSRSMLQRHLELPDGIWAAQDADSDLTLVIANKGKEAQPIERGDVLARAFIMDNNDVETE